MTAVIGMLNKHGVALAADSAVTRTRGNNQKFTKNGNKMVRLSDVVPVCVMITGNAFFIQNPWDVVVRKYRKERGKILHRSVEDLVTDFLSYISESDSFWDKQRDESLFWVATHDFFTELKNKKEIKKLIDDKGKLKSPQKLIEKTLKAIQEIEKRHKFSIKKEPRQSYDFEKFKSIVLPFIDKYFNDDHLFDASIIKAIQTIFPEVSQNIMRALYLRLSYSYGEDPATLVFCGYGKEDIYPSLIALDFKGGFDHHINYSKRGKVNISDETSAAICPFAQTDVIDSLLFGVSDSWLESIDSQMDELYYPGDLIQRIQKENPDDKTLSELKNIDTNHFQMLRKKSFAKMKKANKIAWLKDMKDYDVKSMADLASTLIELTGLQRILTFQQEGVGGELDVAVITKTDGFSWLSRKSWYHHKDIGGRYGKMGV